MFIVCTYNWVELFRGCIESLANQTASEYEYEVIVVDNNCADNTESVTRHHIKLLPYFHYVKEIKQGLSYSRNRWYKEAREDYVAS